MKKLSFSTFLEHLFHICSHHEQEQYWLESARQWRKEADSAEQALSEVFSQKEELAQQVASLQSTLRQVIAATAGNLSPCIEEEKLYRAISAVFDPDGSELLAEAEKMWGKFNYDAHWSKTISCFYENATDEDMFRYLLEDIQETEGTGPKLDSQLAQVYRNTLVKLDLLDPCFYVEPIRKPVPLICSENLTAEQLKALYERHERKLDAAGFTLFHEAEGILGKFDEMDFPYEANHGVFEFADGHTHLRYLLVQHQQKLGNHNCDRWAFPYEECVDLSIDISTKEHQHFEEELYRNTCLKLCLVYRKRELQNELEMRKQRQNASEDLGYKPVSPLDVYTDEEIMTALNGYAMAPSAG